MQQLNAQLLTYHPFIARAQPGSVMMNLGPIDFQIDPQFQISVQAAIPLQRLNHQFQSIYLDASRIKVSSGLGVTYVTVVDTDQTIGIKAGYQGYFPLILNPGSQVLTFSNAEANGSGTDPQILRAILLNTPVVGTTWAVTV